MRNEILSFIRLFRYFCRASLREEGKGRYTLRVTRVKEKIELIFLIGKLQRTFAAASAARI